MPVNNKFTVEEFKNAKKISEAIRDPSAKEALVTRAVSEFAYNPALAEQMRRQFTGYIDNVAKIIDEAPTIKQDLFSEEIMPPDSAIQKAGEKLAVLEYGAGAILQGLYSGTLTQNEIDAFREYYPDMAQKFSQMLVERLANAEFKTSMPQQEKELIGALMGVEVVNPAISGMLMENYKKEDEEEKPGPKPQPKWVEGRFPGTQLSGSYAVEQRRNT